MKKKKSKKYDDHSGYGINNLYTYNHLEARLPYPKTRYTQS